MTACEHIMPGAVCAACGAHVHVVLASERDALRRERDAALYQVKAWQTEERNRRDERNEARAVIAAAVAALSGRSTGDLAADVAGLVELAGRDQSAEIADLRDSLDRLRARVEACGLTCRYHAPPSSCGFCPVCRLRAEVGRVE